MDAYEPIGPYKAVASPGAWQVRDGNDNPICTVSTKVIGQHRIAEIIAGGLNERAP